MGVADILLRLGRYAEAFKSYTAAVLAGKQVGGPVANTRKTLFKAPLWERNQLHRVPLNKDSHPDTPRGPCDCIRGSKYPTVALLWYEGWTLLKVYVS